jgi:transcriptional repressor NrdR
MKCSYCGNTESKVIDSRNIEDGIRRRRQCLNCGTRFTTYEHLQSRNLFVMKKDSRREEFNRDKLLGGVRKACEKRPLPTGTIDKLVDNIEVELYRLGKTEVPSSLIGDMVIERLQELDHIAYIRFASVYREFTDIAALKQAVDTLVDTEAQSPPAGQLPLLSQEELTVLGRQHRRRK